MAELGIMQGRLSPPEGGHIQFFPAKSWREEFERARQCGLDRIEWIIDEPDWEHNPMITPNGRAEIARLSKATGVNIRSACADLFMVYPLHSTGADEMRRREQMVDQIIDCATEAGLEHIDFPFVDASAIASDEAFDTVARIFQRASRAAQQGKLVLCLETSLEPKRFRRLLEKIDRPCVKANYDIGNSASLGYPPDEELAEIGDWLGCVHIKDRKRGASTVPLGTGDADFAAVFRNLRDRGYAGNFVLQAARGPDEIEWTKKNVAFARKWIFTLKETHGLKA